MYKFSCTDKSENLQLQQKKPRFSVTGELKKNLGYGFGFRYCNKTTYATVCMIKCFIERLGLIFVMHPRSTHTRLNTNAGL